LQFVARRQLAGSVAAALIVAAVAAVVTVAAPDAGASKTPRHKFVVIHQPTFVTPVESNFAVMKNRDVGFP
jgi:hypothetical protein